MTDDLQPQGLRNLLCIFVLPFVAFALGQYPVAVHHEAFLAAAAIVWIIWIGFLIEILRI